MSTAHDKIAARELEDCLFYINVITLKFFLQIIKSYNLHKGILVSIMHTCMEAFYFL